MTREFDALLTAAKRGAESLKAGGEWFKSQHLIDEATALMDACIEAHSVPKFYLEDHIPQYKVLEKGQYVILQVERADWEHFTRKGA